MTQSLLAHIWVQVTSIVLLDYRKSFLLPTCFYPWPSYNLLATLQNCKSDQVTLPVKTFRSLSIYTGQNQSPYIGPMWPAPAHLCIYFSPPCLVHSNHMVLLAALGPHQGHLLPLWCAEASSCPLDLAHRGQLWVSLADSTASDITLVA